MKKNNKKGFTIVELVIVIAVIAILAAVLIPTFANVIGKANESAALQGARNAYTAIMAETKADFTKVTAVDNTSASGFAVTTGAEAVKLSDYIKDISSATLTGNVITVVLTTGYTATIQASGASVAKTA